MDTAQWPQEIVVKPIEEIVTNTYPKPPQGNNNLERKAARPQKEQAINCPRCNSTNTKFCYYNNYSLTQPRYFCKTCRRYWTKGGSLRNIPVGGGSRKNRRSSASSNSSNNSASISKNLSLDENPKIPDGHDLNLAFTSTQPGMRNFSEMIQVPSIINKSQNQISSPSANASPSQQISALELLTGMSSRGLASGFMPMPVHHQDPIAGYGQGFPLHDFKPTLSFSLDGLGSGYGSLQENANGRLLFPFEDIKQQQQEVPSTGDDNNNLEQHHKENDGDSAGYWTGMLGGGTW